MSDNLGELDVAFLQHQSGQEVSFHHHSYGQLTIVVAGSVRIQAMRGWWLAIPGAAIWVPAGVSHRAVYTESSELLNLNVDTQLSALSEQISLLMVSPLLMALARQAHVLKQSATDPAQLELIRQLLVCQIRDNQQSSELFISDGEDKRLRAVTALLRDDPGCRMTLHELALIAHSSQRTIARLFEKETGMSFMAWRERLRIITAIERLLVGQTITQVAFDMGFLSPSSFSTAFRKLMGVPPSQYIRHL